MAEIEDPAVAAVTTESEGATTDDDVHLSPTSVCRGGGRGGDGGGSDRIKLRCSFGGRIIPRKNDGALKYVGGETRVLAVPRSIPFRELKKKVEEMFKTEVAAIKYQLLSLSEDLDVLISVTGDDDLAHMLEEYDRLEMKRSPTTSPRFRVYVFAPQAATSPRPVPTLAAAAMPASSRYNAGFSHQHQHHTHHHHHHYQQQQHHHHFPTAGERYVVTVPGTPSGLSPPYPSPAGTVSAGNSPRASAMAADSSTLFESPSVRRGMQRVRSSPNLGSMVDVAAQYLHQHSTEADLCGCGGRDGPGPLVHNSMSGKGYLQQYAQPHMMYPAGSSGRYVPRAGNYHAPPMVPVSRSPDRPFSRGGPVPHGGEMLMAKKPLVWD